MKICKGFEDWLECLKCPYLCSSSCPIESADVIKEMIRQKNGSSVSHSTEDIENRHRE